MVVSNNKKLSKIMTKITNSLHPSECAFPKHQENTLTNRVSAFVLKFKPFFVILGGAIAGAALGSFGGPLGIAIGLILGIGVGCAVLGLDSMVETDKVETDCSEIHEALAARMEEETDALLPLFSP
jgi:hypothetical protein